MTGIQLSPLGYLRNYADSRDISNTGEQANILMLHGQNQVVQVVYRH